MAISPTRTPTCKVTSWILSVHAISSCTRCVMHMSTSFVPREPETTTTTTSVNSYNKKPGNKTHLQIHRQTKGPRQNPSVNSHKSKTPKTKPVHLWIRINKNPWNKDCLSVSSQSHKNPWNKMHLVWIHIRQKRPKQQHHLYVNLHKTPKRKPSNKTHMWSSCNGRILTQLMSCIIILIVIASKALISPNHHGIKNPNWP